MAKTKNWILWGGLAATVAAIGGYFIFRKPDDNGDNGDNGEDGFLSPRLLEKRAALVAARTKAPATAARVSAKRTARAILVDPPPESIRDPARLANKRAALVAARTKATATAARIARKKASRMAGGNIETE